MPCPVCDIHEPTWPTIDPTTGWTFCADCHSAAKSVMRRGEDYEPFSEWLRAIALCRQERWFDAGCKPLAAPITV
jgi:hypothetical protein